MNNGLTRGNIMSTLPSVLANDESLNALAESIAGMLETRMSEIEQINIYSRIDSLPEELLDILADDFKVDWWSPNYTLQEKRNTLRESWAVHRSIGTPAAVEKALSSIYDGTQVQEWFEYGGEPYHFKLIIDTRYQNVDPIKHAEVMQRLNIYKNLRSVLDSVEYTEIASEAKSYGSTATSGYLIFDSGIAELH